MNAFQGTWRDQDGATISVSEENNHATLKYDNGRGPFHGIEIDLGSPVVNVNFTDGVQPAAGVQAGVMNFAKTTITWSNETVWKRV
ncbi:MAG: hypothetical protein AAF617_09195 [Bacteroidota bacterium]